MAKAPKVVHTSMRGVQINMEEMRSANENSVALSGRGGEIRMNARGDTLKNGGRVDKKREQIEQAYNMMPSGKSKRADVRAVEADTFETPQQVMERMARQESKPTPAAVETPRNVVADVFDDKSAKPAKPAGRRLTEKED